MLPDEAKITLGDVVKQASLEEVEEAYDFCKTKLDLSDPVQFNIKNIIVGVLCAKQQECLVQMSLFDL